MDGIPNSTIVKNTTERHLGDTNKAPLKKRIKAVAKKKATLTSKK